MERKSIKLFFILALTMTQSNPAWCGRTAYEVSFWINDPANYVLYKDKASLRATLDAVGTENIKDFFDRAYYRYQVRVGIDRNRTITKVLVTSFRPEFVDRKSNLLLKYTVYGLWEDEVFEKKLPRLAPTETFAQNGQTVSLPFKASLDKENLWISFHPEVAKKLHTSTLLFEMNGENPSMPIKGIKTSSFDGLCTHLITNHFHFKNNFTGVNFQVTEINPSSINNKY